MIMVVSGFLRVLRFHDHDGPSIFINDIGNRMHAANKIIPAMKENIE
jgi:hypothetical protein